jgi:hypothetical protein
MGIESLSPWVSLAAGVLSIGYVVLEEYRRRAGSADDDADGSTGGRSLADAFQKHEGFVVTAVTMFAIAGGTHVVLRSTEFFYPTLIWGVPGFVVVLTGIGTVTGRISDPEG